MPEDIIIIIGLKTMKSVCLYVLYPRCLVLLLRWLLYTLVIPGLSKDGPRAESRPIQISGFMCLLTVIRDTYIYFLFIYRHGAEMIFNYIHYLHKCLVITKCVQVIRGNTISVRVFVRRLRPTRLARLYVNKCFFEALLITTYKRLGSV